MCQAHKDVYFDPTPIRGLDRPSYADESWRPSISDMIRHGAMEISRTDHEPVAPAPAADEYLTASQRAMTPAQRQTLAFLCRKTRELAR
jgi:hypothetical protein